ncbi:hypothetical protein TA3x_001299 [Tundrisphaera sp. TA3]|uniref:hypothetical protein n=1 Tax=Tundrisphaera sp. TA3 TaxID=3435775 RepID=UPI003EBF9156
MSEPAPAGSLEHWIERLTLRIEAESRRADLLEARVIPLLERIAAALEGSGPAVAPAGGSFQEGRASASARFREALKLGDWEAAEAILDGFPPDDPSVSGMADQLARARGAMVEDLHARLEAARSVNDVEGALGIRGQLIPLLEPAAHREIDQVLVKWLMGLIHRRLRGGTIRADVAELAATVAALFGGTSEGASLKAALPTLRRSAGLCPRCGAPHVGEEDLCPKCQAEAAPAAGPFDAGAPEADEDDPGEVEPLDLNNERNWETS